MTDETITLTRDERDELRQLLAELSPRLHSPARSQVDYWSDVLAIHDKWMDRLQPTDDEIAQDATMRYNLRTYGNPDGPGE